MNEEAKARWGGTDAYREFETRAAGKSDEALARDGEGLMTVLARFGELQTLPADAPEVRAQVRALQDYVTAHFYTCTNQILAGLGQLYAADGEFTQNIDAAGGEGTARFAAEAIAVYCGR